MGKLYDDSIFGRQKALVKPAGARKPLVVLALVLAVVVLASIAGWRWWSARQPININTASAEQLESIPEVGPAIAKKIVAGRPYTTPEDLKRVPGIGEKTFEKMRGRVRTQ
jgi:competence ComEA-like helix-hairpin-helix protein